MASELDAAAVEKARDLAERLESHMGLADRDDLVRDCHSAAKTIRAYLDALPAPRIGDRVAAGLRYLGPPALAMESGDASSPAIGDRGKTAEGVEFVVVRKYPTHLQKKAGSHVCGSYDIAHECYRVMVAATLPAPPSEDPAHDR